MNDVPLPALLAALAVLLAVSGLFSLAETAMMAANRHRLKHRAGRGHAGARLALELLGRTDRLLGVILLGNNLINAAAATLTAVIVARLFGQGELALALGTLAVTFMILVFSEITPKVIGAAHADRLAPVVSYVLNPLLKPPVTWVVAFVNVFVQALLRLLRIRPGAAGDAALTQEEIRSLVLEGHYFRGKHRAMLANLFDLEHTTVDDVMTPRHQIDALDVEAEPALMREQLATCYHTSCRCTKASSTTWSACCTSQVVALQQSDDVGGARLRELVRPPYYVPAGTPVFTQLSSSSRTASGSAWWSTSTASSRGW